MKIPSSPAASPPGPFRSTFWRSPLRGAWLTSILGSLLLVLVAVVAVTGFISHAQYQPQLGHNAIVPRSGDLAPLLSLPSFSPAWLYAVTQGLHVTVGLVAIPVLLAKLWSVIPRLFQWPPVGSPAQAVERVSVLLLVGGALFEFTTGVLNIQLFYPWHFGFVRAHYYGAWVFVAALVLHVAVKLPTVGQAYRTYGLMRPLKANLAQTRPHDHARDDLAPVRPAAPTISRRGLFGLVGGASLALLLTNLGESVGGPLRRFALLAPRGRVFGTGPNDFQVNKTAAAVGVTRRALDPAWRVTVYGRGTRSFSRAELMALPQHTRELTIACVEGWSTTQRWTGVRLADLARLVAVSTAATLEVESIQPEGPFRRATYGPGHVADDRSLLALCVNGVDLSLDHGYPARIVIPSIPGVHCTKWVGTMRFTPV